MVAWLSSPLGPCVNKGVYGGIVSALCARLIAATTPSGSKKNTASHTNGGAISAQRRQKPKPVIVRRPCQNSNHPGAGRGPFVGDASGLGVGSVGRCKFSQIEPADGWVPAFAGMDVPLSSRNDHRVGRIPARPHHRATLVSDSRGTRQLRL